MAEDAASKEGTAEAVLVLPAEAGWDVGWGGRGATAGAMETDFEGMAAGALEDTFLSGIATQEALDLCR